MYTVTLRSAQLDPVTRGTPAARLGVLGGMDMMVVLVCCCDVDVDDEDEDEDARDADNDAVRAVAFRGPVTRGGPP